MSTGFIRGGLRVKVLAKFGGGTGSVLSWERPRSSFGGVGGEPCGWYRPSLGGVGGR